MRPALGPALVQAFALLAALGALVWPARPAAADSVELVGGETVAGVVRSLADGKLTLDVSRPASPSASEDKLFNAILGETDKKGAKPAGAPQQLRTVPLTDVVQIKFEPVFDRSHDTPPLIDNDRAKGGRPASGSIKLRAGYHRFLLAYWHRSGGAFVSLARSRIERPDEDRQRYVRGDMLAHLESGATETPSPGFDKQGYRLPETIKGAVAPQLGYSLRRIPDGRPPEKMSDVLGATLIVGHGLLDRIGTQPFPDENENLVLLFSGYLNIKQDGLYKFVLASDGGSRLYIGQTPGGLRAMDSPVAKAPWSVTLAEGGALRGTIEKWTGSTIDLGIAASRSRVSLSIPSALVTRIWSAKADQVDRSNLPADKDVVFARSSAGAVQRVPGRVQGIQGESLVLRFNGEDRKIGLSKVVGIALAADRRAASADETFHQIVEIEGGNKIPAQLTSLDPLAAKLSTPWGQTVTLRTEDLTAVAVKNGKAISLTDLKPSRVEQVPFFDRMIAYRVNESLSGGPILLRDGRHSRGISVHAKTVLSYQIGGRFQRFRAKVGFQLPEGELGDASVRVLGDQKPLFVRPSLRGDGPIEPIDLDVSGVGTLTLAVDFGPREDIGDRVVWADPLLIRAETGPLGKSLHE